MVDGAPQRDGDASLLAGARAACTRSPVRVALLFGLFGFVMHFRPAEPFITPYLIEDKGLSEDEVNNKVYPVWTYSYLAFLVVVGPFAEAVGYKLVVVVFALADLSTRAILVWGSTLAHMQTMQVTYGLSTAAEIGYYSLIYLLVDEEHYQRVTSYTRALVLMGSVLAGLLAQALVSLAGSPYLLLFQLTFATSAVGTLVSLGLPSASATARPVRSAAPRAPREWFAYYWAELRAAYSSARLLRWSLWWSLAFCTLLAVEGYASSIWYHIDASVAFNGFCDSVGRLAGALGSVGPSLLAARALVRTLLPRRLAQRRPHSAAQNRWAEPLLLAGSLACFAWVLWMALTTSIWAAYATYILFEGTAYFLLALAAAKIAALVANERYALVFGVNTFLALVMSTAMQLLAGPAALDMDIRERFYMNASVAGALCVAAGAAVACRPLKSERSDAYEQLSVEVDE